MLYALAITGVSTLPMFYALTNIASDTERYQIYFAYPTFVLIVETKCDLKEYYEIVDEARPLSGFFPTHADFFTEMHF